MPVYDYSCESCGPFTVLRPMAQFRDPHDCPDCGQSCERAFLTAPRLSGMEAGVRAAHAANERSRHAPRRSHGAGCGCCAPGKAAGGSAKSGLAKSGSAKSGSAKSGSANGSPAKSFPAARPWMISH